MATIRLDAAMIRRYIIGLVHPSFNEAAADVDGDGEVTIVDATWIQRYNIGMRVPHPVGEYILI